MFGWFVRAMREFSRYISSSGVGNVPGIFMFLAWYHHDLKEPWLLKSGLPWFSWVAHWKDDKDVRNLMNFQRSESLTICQFEIQHCLKKLPWKNVLVGFCGTMRWYSALYSARAPNQGCRLWHRMAPMFPSSGEERAWLGGGVWISLRHGTWKLWLIFLISTVSSFKVTY